MSEVETEKTRIRDQLSEMLRRVPPSVRDGSVQQARAFKVFHGKAMKILGSAKSTLPELQSLRNQVYGMYE